MPLLTRGCFAGPKTYSGSCSGNLFSERLVDPHDVDQTYESAHNACVTWVIEEAPVELVSVGSSDGATKTVKVPGVLGAEPVPFNEIPPSEASILFDVKVEQESGTIVVAGCSRISTVNDGQIVNDGCGINHVGLEAVASIVNRS